MSAELNQSFRVNPADLPGEAVIFGCTPAMREVQSKIDLLRSSDHPVLIQGESGTGKEVVARFLHARSNRSDAPFVKLNCAAIPCDLLEIELFGCVNRVSTRAGEDRPGLVEIAEGGSIFLDEVGELDWGLQGRLLDLLQGGSYCPIGAHERRTASVRLICASNVDLLGSVQRGKFREGLLGSIDAGSLHLSALRERKGDIPQLCDYLLQKLARQLNRIAPRLNPSTLHLLKQWDWPGNLRELENWIARAIVFGEDVSLNSGLERRIAGKRAFRSREHRIGASREAPRQPAFTAASSFILKVLQENHWNRRKTAEDLKMSYRSLLYRLREVGVHLPRKNHRSFPSRH
jgi:two-component system, NtrC family, response regulator AtoC